MEQKKKLVFFYPPGQDTFLRPIIEALKGEYNIEEFTGGDEQYFYKVLHSADICWFEWGNDLIKQVSTSPAYSKYVCRIHSYEIFDGIHHNVNWDKISKLILVNDSVKDIIRNGLPGAMGGVPETSEEGERLGAPKFGTSFLHLPESKIKVIYHGLDDKKMQIKDGKGFGKKIVLAGYLNYKKAPELALQAMAAIYEYDPEFEFHIVGIHQDLRYVLYFQHIMKQSPFSRMKFFLDPWQKDMNAYYADKDFVISSSLFESFHMSIAEGMLTGCVPIIHNWFGAQNLYPNQYIWTVIPEAVKIVQNYINMSIEEKTAQRDANRLFIQKMYSFDREMKEIRELLASL